jgi:hypothetical protein
MRSISSSKTSGGKIPSPNMWVRNNYSANLGIYLVVQHTRRIHTGAAKRPRPISILMADNYAHHKHAGVRVLGKEFVLRNHQLRNIVPTATGCCGSGCRFLPSCSALGSSGRSVQSSAAQLLGNWASDRDLAEERRTTPSRCRGYGVHWLCGGSSA